MIIRVTQVKGGWGEKRERERIFQPEGVATFKRIQGEVSHFSLCGRILLDTSLPTKSLVSIVPLSAISSLSPCISHIQFMLGEPGVRPWSLQSCFLSGTKLLDQEWRAYAGSRWEEKALLPP